jgi:hypothetical protein
MMAKQREARPNSWKEVLDLVDAVLTGTPSHAHSRATHVTQTALARQAQEALARQHRTSAKRTRQDNDAEPDRQEPRRRKARGAALAVIVVVAAICAVIGIVTATRRKPATPTQRLAAAETQEAEATRETTPTLAPPAHTPGDKPRESTPADIDQSSRETMDLGPDAAQQNAEPETSGEQGRPEWDRIILPHSGDWELDFDGIDDYVAIPTLKYEESHPLTLEAVLAYPYSKVSIAAQIGKGARLAWWDDQWHFLVGDLSVADKTTVLTPARRLLRGRPVHIAGTYDGQRAALFINGKKVADEACRIPIPTGSFAAAAGAAPNEYGHGASTFLRGNIACLRVSRTVRYNADFDLDKALPFTADADTVCLFDIEEGEGDVATDASGNGHDGEIHGAMWRRMWPCPVSEEKLREIEEALKDANPRATDYVFAAEGFLDGISLTFAESKNIDNITPLRDLKLTSLSISRTAVASLHPVAGQPLWRLQCESTRIRDLSPLKGSRLVTLNAGGTPVEDVSPLENLQLRYLSLWGTNVHDIAPVKGMPLVFLHLSGAPVADLSPVKGMHLSWLCVGRETRDLTPLDGMPLLYLGVLAPVGQITPLEQMPLQAVALDAAEIDDLTPLQKLPDLRSLFIKNQRHALPQLKGVTVGPMTQENIETQCKVLRKVWRGCEVELGWAAYPTPKPVLPVTEIAEMLVAQRYDKALKLIAAVKPESEEDENLFCARNVCGMPRRILESIKNDVGKTVEIRLNNETVECEIEAVENDAVEVRQIVRSGQNMGKIGRTIHYDQLTVQEKFRRLGTEETNELNIMRGLLANEAGRPDVAQKFLAKAGGPLADALKGLMQKQEPPGRNRKTHTGNDDAEQAARKLLRAIARSTAHTKPQDVIAEIRAKCAGSASRMRGARKLLETYRKQYGDTDSGIRWSTLIQDALAYPTPGENCTVPELDLDFVWIEPLKLWVGKYEVTNEQYRAKESKHSSGGSRSNSLNGNRQPVVQVSFQEAADYAVWLTDTQRRIPRLPQNLRYRLPTEKEWLAFCQCGQNRKYPWGDQWPPERGNYSGQESAWERQISGYNDGHPVTCNVEDAEQNEWELFGVGGNVWEACAKNDALPQILGAWRGASWVDYRELELACGSSNPCDFAPLPRSQCAGFRLLLATVHDQAAKE